MTSLSYRELHGPSGVPVKAWIHGVPLEDKAKEQLFNVAKMPIVHSHLAVMPDVHLGYGATVGSVIPTKKAIIPAAVGVDIGCGMMAVKTSLTANDLPDNLEPIRSLIEKAVPHGRSKWKQSTRDKGSWHHLPGSVAEAWSEKLLPGFEAIREKYPHIEKTNNAIHLGTLGTGNHFIEMCLDKQNSVWIMLHSGSRGVGNWIGSRFIEMARDDMRSHLSNLPDKDLAYVQEGTQRFDDYVEAVSWAQTYARINREIMMTHVLATLRDHAGLPPFKARMEAVNCHHNYVSLEHHFGEDVWVTRKGAVRAGKGQMGIIPGSMGARSYIVRGLGNPDSFESCSHGAGRVMSRTKARKTISLEEHLAATEGVACRKDEGVIDESPAAYKDIEAVMAAQADLVEIVYELKQVVCVKG